MIRISLCDEVSTAALVVELKPVIERQVRFSLRPYAGLARRDAEAEVSDFVQEVFIELFANDARSLRRWDPERGRSLKSFVRLIARRRVASLRRGRYTNPWHDELVSAPEADTHPSRANPDATLESVDMLEQVASAVERRMGERGIRLLKMLYFDQWSVVEVQAETGMSRDAVYAWRSRLRRMANQIAGRGESA